MKNVKVVIGANFGDEGKGLMTDYFCSKAPSTEKVLNVRFSGGVQAEHEVITPEGKRHIFSHFGSGSFLPNVATYLTKDFIINPIRFHAEYEDLLRMGIRPLIYCHPECLITFFQDMVIGEFLGKRGLDYHRSAGTGIFETVTRSRKDSSISVATLTILGMKHFLIDIEYYSIERIEKIFGIQLSNEEKEELNNQNTRAQFDQDLRFLVNHICPCDERIFKAFKHVVFEGSHGLLLDQNNREYFPNLAMCNTGLQNVVPYLDGQMETEVCYVTRPYLTRSGDGKIPNKCKRTDTGAKEESQHLDFQYGKLNVKDLMDRCEKDFSLLPFPAKQSYAVTHMDEALKSDWMPYSDTLYFSYGRTRNDVKKLFEED